MTLAIFPGAGIGDGIIQLVLAQNLAKIGLQIDYYHHFPADINNLIKGVNVYKPSNDTLKEAIGCYVAFLLDRGSKNINLSGYLDQIESKVAVHTMARKNTNLIDSSDYDLVLSLSGVWQRLENKKRVLIHPTSVSEKKNWLPDRFINLAKKLKNRGCEPILNVPPSEHENWENKLKNEFELPFFKNIRDLAKNYYGSSFFISSDSGKGHLASALGLPTITFVNRFSIPFPWRPNWSTNIIVRPLLSRKLVGNYYWKYTISDNRVMESIKKMQP